MKVALIGFGNMGKAISKALARNGGRGIMLSVIDRHHSEVRAFAKKHGRDFRGVKDADAVILAVKPQDLSALAAEIKGEISASSLLISIAAGVDIKRLIKLFGHARTVRTMPNLGLLVGQGIVPWRSAPGLGAKDKKKAKALLDLIAENFEVGNEEQLDIVTAVSGSGPAYFLYLAEHLLLAAAKLGLPRERSITLVQKTLLAAAALQTEGTYSELIKRIASKKGATEAALKVFHAKKMDRIISEAVSAARKRAKELRNA